MIRHFGLRNVGCLWWLFLFVCVLFVVVIPVWNLLFKLQKLLLILYYDTLL